MNLLETYCQLATQQNKSNLTESDDADHKHYVLDVQVHSHPSGKLKRKFKAGAHPDEASAHKAARAFYKKNGIKVKSITTRRAYRPMSSDAKRKAKVRYYQKTGAFSTAAHIASGGSQY